VTRSELHTYLALLRGERLAPARDSRRHAHQRRGCRLRRQLAHVPRLGPLGQRHHGQAVTSAIRAPRAVPVAPGAHLHGRLLPRHGRVVQVDSIKTRVESAYYFSA